METLKELLAIGKQYFDSKQYAQAESYFRRVLEKNGRYADVLNMLGVINHAEGRFSTAVEFFQDALKLNPHYTEAILNLAVLHNDLGQYQEARKLYSKLKTSKIGSAPRIEPVLSGKLSNLHADVGDIYRSIGMNKQAIEEYKKALILNPRYLDIRTKLAAALRENNELVNSLKELKTVLRSNAKYLPAIIQLGITYYSMGKNSEAVKSWKKVLAENPENENAHMYIKLCESVSGYGKKVKKKVKRK